MFERKLFKRKPREFSFSVFLYKEGEADNNAKLEFIAEQSLSYEIRENVATHKKRCTILKLFKFPAARRGTAIRALCRLSTKEIAS